ncbi:MAG: tripartite tricarboxylate transporter substrate binding protein [Burkholderiaceae bacterium]|nr:tripartite tricarboxylate transporter substrate binding protein [Burkholderiaceae bacterium]
MNRFQPNRRQLLALSALGALPSLGRAQSSRPVRIVVPFAPGGGNDVLGRQMANGLTESTGRSHIVENRAGAGGNIGTEFVVRAAADGTTLLLGHTGTISINPALYTGLKFDVQKDLTPVAMFATSALVLVVSESSPIQSMADLVTAIRRADGNFNYASSGAGTGGHLTAEMLAHMLGTKMTHIPYKGTAPALTDVVGGQVQMMFSVIPPAQALVASGKLRALAVTSAKRLAQLPNVPTVAESGVAQLKGFESTLTYGLLAPRATPAPAIEALGRQILQVAGTAAFQSKLGVEGAEPLLGDATQYAALIQRESAKWGAVIKASGATV